jgi:hypothetical protein
MNRRDFIRHMSLFSGGFVVAGHDPLPIVNFGSVI